MTAAIQAKKQSHRHPFIFLWKKKQLFFFICQVEEWKQGAIIHSLVPQKKICILSLLSVWSKDTKDSIHLIKEQVQWSGKKTVRHVKNHKGVHRPEQAAQTSTCSYYWGNWLSWPGSHLVYRHLLRNPLMCLSSDGSPQHPMSPSVSFSLLIVSPKYQRLLLLLPSAPLTITKLTECVTSCTNYVQEEFKPHLGHG